MTSSRSNLLSLASSRPAELGAEPTENVLTLRGSLGVVSALDVLQWLCNARQSWTVRLHGQGVDGDVIVHEGELVSARWGGLFGVTALTEIVSCDWGYFELMSPTRTIENNLFGSWQSLLLEAVHELDERRREREQRSRSQPPTSARPPVSPTGESGEHSLAELFPDKVRDQDGCGNGWPSSASKCPETTAQDAASTTAHTLIDQGFAALRTGNLNEARKRWSEALVLAPDNRRIQFNLRKLDSMPRR
jgi:hypothetical protein